MGTAAEPGDTGMAQVGGAVPDRPADHRTFLIADIRGYTSYTDERGDEAAAALANQFARIVREVVEARDGTLVELRGDEALTVFTSARQALRAAVELQAHIADEQLPRGVGIGLDAGEAVPVEGGYRGTALNVAARLCAQAAAGEILATETVIHLAARIEGIHYREPRSMRLKGFENPFRVVGVRAEAAATGAARSSPGRAVARPMNRRPAIAALVAVAVLVVGGALVFAQGLGGRGSAAPGTSVGGNLGAGSGAGGGLGAASQLPGGPSTLPSPGASLAPAADVPMYKGGLGRTNQMPGPALERSPEVRWELKTGSDMGAGPAVAGNLVFAGSIDGTLHVVDLATGKEAWTFAAGAPILTVPTVVDGSIYLTTDDGVFHAVDLATHAERWRVSGVAVGSVPTVVGDLAYVGIGSGRFAALSTTDGHEAWHVDVQGTANRNAIAGSVAYVVGEDSDRVYAVDLTTHAIRWSAATGAARLLTPAVDGDTVYVTVVNVANKDSRVVALDAITGEQRWQFVPPDRASLATLAVGADQVYSTSDGPSGTTSVWAVDRATGGLRWKASVPGSLGIHPVSVGDEVVVSSIGAVVALTAATGKEVWQYVGADRPVGSPVITGGLLISDTSAGTSPAAIVALGAARDSPATVPAAAIECVKDLTAGDGNATLYLNVMVDAKGNVYAADRVSNRVVVWDRGGRPTSWGKHGSKPGQFDFSEVTIGDQSQSVAVARDGRIAVGDGGNHRVQVFDAKRHFLMAIGHEGEDNGEFVNPCCIAFDTAGRLYVADPGRGDIQVFDKKGRFVRTIGSKGSGNGQFNRLGVPYIDPASGDVWVPDFGNRRIEVMTQEGQFVAAFGDGSNGTQALDQTNGVVLDRSGRMWIVDTDDFVYVLDPVGRLIARLGPELVAGHGYIAPPYLWLTDDGRLYLPDSVNNRVAVFQIHEPLWPPH